MAVSHWITKSAWRPNEKNCVQPSKHMNKWKLLEWKKSLVPKLLFPHFLMPMLYKISYFMVWYNFKFYRKFIIFCPSILLVSQIACSILFIQNVQKLFISHIWTSFRKCSAEVPTKVKKKTKENRDHIPSRYTLAHAGGGGSNFYTLSCHRNGTRRGRAGLFQILLSTNDAFQKNALKE